MPMKNPAVVLALLVTLISTPLVAIDLGGEQVPKEKFRVILYMGDSCTGGWSYHSDVYAAPIEPFGSGRIWRLRCLDPREQVTNFSWVRGEQSLLECVCCLHVQA
jgi:hypothetical protein